MIDKRINFQGGGADMGDPGRAQERADRGYGSTAGPDRSRTSEAQDANQRAQVREGQVRAVENLIDRPTFGFNDAARINLFNPGNILGGILGLINPALGLGFRAVNYLKDEIPETLGQFKDSATLEEFRDKVRGYGRTMPTISPNPMYGGIESLAVNPLQQLPGNNLRTEVTKMDLQKFKQPMTQTMDYDTYMSINPGSTLTPYEFEQLKQGNITQPGTYVG